MITLKSHKREGRRVYVVRVRGIIYQVDTLDDAFDLIERLS